MPKLEKDCGAFPIALLGFLFTCIAFVPSMTQASPRGDSEDSANRPEEDPPEQDLPEQDAGDVELKDDMAPNTMWSSARASLRLGILLQPGFEVFPNHLNGSRNGFALHRTRIRLEGHFISKNLSYLITGDALNGFEGATRRNGPGSETRPKEGEPQVPFLLDGLVRLHLPQFGIVFTFGRFCPKWGLLMPEKVAALGAISYPLYVHGAKNSLGIFRNIGLEAELEIKEFLHVGGGVYNGGVNSWLDDNDRKDFVAHIDITPLTGLAIRASALFAFPEANGGIRLDGTAIERGHETFISPILEARYQDFGFDVMAGFASAIIKRHDNDIRRDYNSYGVMGHIGYILVGDWFQLMVRGEWWEPNTQTPDDEQVRITAGPQFLIENLSAFLSINYIQDIFFSKSAMCETYLRLDACGEFDRPPEAQNNASTIILQFTIQL